MKQVIWCTKYTVNQENHSNNNFTYPHMRAVLAMSTGEADVISGPVVTIPLPCLQAASLTVDSCSENQEPGYCTVSNVAVSDDW